MALSWEQLWNFSLRGMVFWLKYIGDLLRKPDRQGTEKKRDPESLLATEILSQVDVMYKSSDRMNLSDAREAS